MSETTDDERAWKAELLELATPRLDEIAAAAATAIWEWVPAYRASADPNLREQVRTHCRSVFQTLLICLRENRPPTHEDYGSTGDNALFRVSQGISLSDFLHAFRVGQLTFFEHIVALQQHGLSQRAVLNSVAPLMNVIEIGSPAAATAYLGAEQYRLADRDRLNRELVEDLLAGRSPTIPPRVAFLRASGLGTDGRLVVFCARVRGARDETAALRTTLERVRDTHGRDAPILVASRGSELVGVLPTGSSGARAMTMLTDAHTRLRHEGVITAVGASTVHQGLASIPGAFREAHVAVDALGPAGGVLSLSSLSAFDYLMLTDDGTALRLVEPEVRTFVEEDLAADGVFLDTLAAYVASDLNAKSAAQRLHVHVNTAYYRLERIAERTGKDLREIGEVIDLMVAVRLLTGRTVRDEPDS